MSKITNDSLTQSGWHRMLFNCTRMATVGVKSANTIAVAFEKYKLLLTVRYAGSTWAAKGLLHYSEQTLKSLQFCNAPSLITCMFKI